MKEVFGGRYRVLRRLGSGGMASVYLAHDPMLTRDVAIKVPRLDGDGADAEAIERFQAELQTIGRLNHPNIVTIYDGGEDDGQPYLVMEPVEGESLAELIKREAPLPAPFAVDVARQVAQALAYAHNLGLIHRDVKPHNILLDRAGRAKVTDFGIAKSADVTRTMAGTILGTPSFMAPEVSAGERATVKSDIYALGVVLYQMLTGHAPFESDNAIATAVRSQREDPRPPSTLAPVPSWLDAVVLKALARNPGERYNSAAEMASDLEAARTDISSPGPKRVVKPKPAPRIPKPRRTIAWLLPVAIVVIACAGIAFAATHAPGSASPAASPSASARTTPAASAGAKGNLLANGNLLSTGEQPAGWRLEVFQGGQPFRFWRPGGPAPGDREITIQSSSGVDAAWIGTDAAVKPGTKLTLSGFIKTDGVPADGPGAALHLVCHSPDGKITGQATSASVKGGAGWQEQQARLTAPGGTTACLPELRLGDGGHPTSGTAEFSRIALVAS